jgi:type IV secretion system protein VirB10
MTEQNNGTPPSGQDISKLASKDEIKSELSKVASNPKQSIAILVVVGLIFAYFAYSMFQSDQENNDDVVKVAVPVPTEIVRKDTNDIKQDNIQVPSLPEPPKLESPSAPPPPPPMPVMEAKAPELPPLPMMEAPKPSAVEVAPPMQNMITTNADEKLAEDETKKKQARRTSSMMLINGGSKTAVATKAAAIANSVKKDTSVDYSKYYVLNRGKIIDAIIETALNTDTGGEVRAIITKDVYADHGDFILIPRGSEILGSYQADFSSGRMDIKWTRLNLEDDYYLDLAESSVDNLGRKGVQGRLDEKNQEKLVNTVFVSAFNIGVGNILDQINKTAGTDPTAVSQKGLNDSVEIRSALTKITNNTDGSVPTSPNKINEVCTTILQKLLNKQYMNLYTELQTKCDEYNHDYAADDNSQAQASANYSDLSAYVNAQALALVQLSSATAATESSATTATKEAFDDITGLAKNMLSNDKLKATVTIDQGTNVKIYVKQNYFFPKEVVRKYQ